MRKFFPCLAMLGLLSLPLASRADTFNFTVAGSAGGFSGSGTFTATQSGTHYLVTAISGTGIGGLIAPGAFNGNDNFLFPASNPFVDGSGIAFTDAMGNTSFKVDLFSMGASNYFVYLLDNDGFTTTLPVTFSVTPATTPEPSSLVLLGTGALGLAGAARRRFRRA